MQRLYQKTDKHLIPALERFSFPGRIEVIQSEQEACRAISVLRRHNIVGIDTETRPTFRRGAMRPVALLQISTLDICFLFRLNMIGLPTCVADLLEDPAIRKVGLSLINDAQAMKRRSRPLKPAAWIDIQPIVRQMGIEDQSLQKIVANVLGKYLSKRAQLTNWEADVLTEAQKLYAATDAYACLVLYHRLTDLQQSGDYVVEKPESPQSSN